MLKLLVLLVVVSVARSEECDDLCQDYHRFCDDLRAGKTPEQLTDVETEILAQEELSCDNYFWENRCPATCKQCTTCDDDSNKSVYLSSTKSDSETSLKGKVFSTDQGDTWVSSWTAAKMVDGAEDTNINNNQCFVSGTASSWGELYLDDNYEISKVKMLSRSDYLCSRAATTHAYVCTSPLGTGCTDCGAFGGSGCGVWMEVSCPSGTVGNTIHFAGSGNDFLLQICEADIFGYENTYTPELVDLKSKMVDSDQQDVWSASWTADKMFDGGLDTNINNNQCFVSGTASGWGEVYLDSDYEVYEVSILSRSDYLCNRAATTRAYVCTGSLGNGCVDCGAFLRSTCGAWMTTYCPTRTVGNTIRFEDPNRTGDYLVQICEIEAYGVPA